MIIDSLGFIIDDKQSATGTYKPGRVFSLFDSVAEPVEPKLF